MKIKGISCIKSFIKILKYKLFEDGHNGLETPVLIPNTEVKLPMLMAVVSDKTPNHQAVFFQILYKILILNKCMKIKLSKTEAQKQIQEFFSNIKNKTPREIKKIKKLAMSYNIKLGEKKKLFCKKCYEPYKNSKIRIKKKIKSIVCKECGHVSRWKMK